MLGIQSSTFEKSFGDRSNTCMNLVACSYEQLLSRSHVVSHLWRFRQRSRLPGEMLRFSADKVEEFGSEFREIVQDSVNTLCEACCLLFWAPSGPNWSLWLILSARNLLVFSLRDTFGRFWSVLASGLDSELMEIICTFKLILTHFCWSLITFLSIGNPFWGVQNSKTVFFDQIASELSQAYCYDIVE